MSEPEIKNAIIKSARLQISEGPLEAWLDLDYGGTGQGFGGYALYLNKTFRNYEPSGPNYAGHFIARVMEIADVTEWTRIVGKTIRVKSEHSKVHAIGHIVRDDWFDPTQDFRQMERGHKP